MKEINRSARIARHLLLPLMAPAALFALYFTPKSVFGCANRGLMALGVVLLATIGAAATTWKGVSARREGEIEAANWWLLTTVILLSPILLLFGPLARKHHHLRGKGSTMKKISGPTVIPAAGNIPKIIEEYFGRVNTGAKEVSIARMLSPAGWTEPGQTPEFDEYTVVLKGVLHVDTMSGSADIHAGEGVLIKAGEWVRYGSPGEEGAEYIAVCIPAFAPDTVHRDDSSST